MARLTESIRFHSAVKTTTNEIIFNLQLNMLDQPAYMQLLHLSSRRGNFLLEQAIAHLEVSGDARVGRKKGAPERGAGQSN